MQGISLGWQVDADGSLMLALGFGTYDQEIRGPVSHRCVADVLPKAVILMQRVPLTAVCTATTLARSFLCPLHGLLRAGESGP